MSTAAYQVALLGNPNSGKSTVFNQLTGLHQKIGNFPGVTVDKRLGHTKLDNSTSIVVIDFPGTYSLFPVSQDERIVVSTFLNPADENYPDLVLYVADVTNLERQLLLLTQIRDLGLPVILALNMMDLADKAGIHCDTKTLSELLNVPVVSISGRSGENIPDLKRAILTQIRSSEKLHTLDPFYKFSGPEEKTVALISENFGLTNDYRSKMLAHHYDWLPFLTTNQRVFIKNAIEQSGFENLKLQIRETMQRYDRFIPIAQKAIKKSDQKPVSLTDRIDRFTLHPILGPVIFFLLMMIVFQAIFSWSSYPMDWIEIGFGSLSGWVQKLLPPGWLTDLLTEGILSGLGGIIVFVPQIAILFLLISVLEEVGYMARAVFIFDKLMQKFGLNGRSIVALISGGACAIPAIMSTRTISNWKERLITILVTPLISCSARIPVYTVLIGFVVPSVTVGGLFNLQGLAFMGLYLLGIVAALSAALVFKLILKTEEVSYLMIELPPYRLPLFRNIILTVWEKVKTFVLEAGKIILIISIILWFMASFGPPAAMKQAEIKAEETAKSLALSKKETENLLTANKIEASYAGLIGKGLEPLIQPLGFDWKIGIALVTSFAAREVFVSTMATIYSIGSDDDEWSVRKRMAVEINPKTGMLMYTRATALSLIVFYVFAMQCMSTLAVVKRETRRWKWPIIQFLFMSSLAYLASFSVFQLFS